MVESPFQPWLPSAPYWVMEVGKHYEYAVVYACVGALGGVRLRHLQRLVNACACVARWECTRGARLLVQLGDA